MVEIAKTTSLSKVVGYGLFDEGGRMIAWTDEKGFAAADWSKSRVRPLYVGLHSADDRMCVYDAINGERDYQDEMTALSDRPDMVDPMPLPAIILAMEHCLSEARKQWYSDAEPYQPTMHLVRKVAALAVKAGEQYGMPTRT